MSMEGYNRVPWLFVFLRTPLAFKLFFCLQRKFWLEQKAYSGNVLTLHLVGVMLNLHTSHTRILRAWGSKEGHTHRLRVSHLFTHTLSCFIRLYLQKTNSKENVYAFRGSVQQSIKPSLWWVLCDCKNCMPMNLSPSVGLCKSCNLSEPQFPRSVK